MLISILIPLIGGLLISALKLRSRRIRMVLVEAITVATSLSIARLLYTGCGAVQVVKFSHQFALSFALDGAGRVFLGLIAFLWPLAVLYAAEYMQHEEREATFFGWYTMTYAVAVMVCLSANLFTMYLAFECMTMVTLPLVWHKKDDSSMRAARSYVFYCVGCAGLAFAATVILSWFGCGNFTVNGHNLAGMPLFLMQLTYLLAFLGFGVKAAVFPISAWLPKACAAPTPVTALLHAVAVVNTGVFCVLRVTYYVFGAETIHGGWAQTLCLCLASATVLYGAVMAVREGHVKYRLAYSTVSNLGYMLTGIALATRSGMVGGFMHMISHSLMKITLFFCIGAVIVQTGRTRLHEMHGLGRRMPFVFSVFVFAAIALMGIPPLSGFVGKYYLITAQLEEGSISAVIASCTLIVSSILTAVYTLTMLIPAWTMPLENAGELREGSLDPTWRMLVPLGILCAAIAVLGVFPGRLAAFLMETAGKVG